MKLLGINEVQLALAHKLSSEEASIVWAMEKLNVEPLDLRRAAKIKESGGLKTWAMKLLKIEDENSLNEFHAWRKMGKAEKIESLVPKISSPRDFFNLAYTYYLGYKAKNKASWKRKEAKEHLLKIKQIADACIVRDELTLNEARQIAMHAYFAIWTAIAAAPEDVAKTIPLNVDRSDLAMAA